MAESVAAVSAYVALNFAIRRIAEAVFPDSLAAAFWSAWSRCGCGV